MSINQTQRGAGATGSCSVSPETWLAIAISQSGGKYAARYAPELAASAIETRNPNADVARPPLAEQTPQTSQQQKPRFSLRGLGGILASRIFRRNSGRKVLSAYDRGTFHYRVPSVYGMLVENNRRS